MDAIWVKANKNIMSGFNPRARDGRDKAHYINNSLLIVSIHAPVMDAISHGLGLARRDYGFNPRARDGRDLITS